jgi:hypothetical protein
MPSKPIATIPQDLRGRDLRIADIERIVHLRKERTRLMKRATAFESRARQALDDAAATMREELQILGVEDRAPAGTGID